MKFYPWIWIIPPALLIIAGCQPAVPPNFQSSEQVRALGADAETDDERRLWRDLRYEIVAQLTKHVGTPQNPKLLGSPRMDPRHLQHGAAVFTKRCQPCHGTSGDGNGPVAQYLSPPPRDYRKGIFKFTSLPYGAKPRREDLLRTIRRGVTGTSMPSFAELPDEDLQAVVDYVLVLSHRGELEQELVFLAEDEGELDPEIVEDVIATVLEPWQLTDVRIVTPVTPMPPMTDESIAQGHKLFLDRACNKCHGKDGRGGSLGNVDVGEDAWGHKAAAADLTSGMFRGGGRPIDIYRRIYAGINGTPMPAFSGMFQENPEAVWQLVHFVLDAGQRRRRDLPPLDAAAIEALERELGITTAGENEPAPPETTTEQPPGETTESAAEGE